MAPGGVLVFSFPCLNSEDSPDQLRFIPILRKPEYEEWTLRSLLSFHCTYNKERWCTSLPVCDVSEHCLVGFLCFQFPRLSSEQAPDQLIDYAVSLSLGFVHANKYGLRIWPLRILTTGLLMLFFRMPKIYSSNKEYWWADHRNSVNQI